MSDDKLYDQIQRGQMARDLLENVLLAEAFNTLDAAYVKAWRESSPRDALAREKLWVAANIIGKVRDHLRIALDDGKLAQADLNFRNAAVKRAA